MGRLSGKVAIVTGCASPIGFGFATARRYAREGARVLMTDLRAEAVAARGAELRGEGHTVLDGAQDVADPAGWTHVVARAVAEFGRLDVLVNNAGIVEPGGIAESSLENWHRHLSVNLTGLFLGCQAAVRQLRAQGGGGSIINVSSVAGIAAFPGLAAYCASKGGVRLLTKAAALDVAAEGIRVNSVHPGHLDTEMLAYAKEVAPQMVLAMIENIPMKRLGVADDIAAMNLFLASDESRYVTGTEMVVDGGLMAK